MWPMKRFQAHYHVLKDPDEGVEGVILETDQDLSPTKRRVWHSAFAVLVGLLLLGTGFIWGFFARRGLSFPILVGHSGSKSKCASPSIRQEWRTFSLQEKTQYIDAVRCLTAQPSTIRNKGVLYDDFPFIHNSIGGYSHGAAPFLSWHRYFLSVYEGTLRGTCGYNGSLAYWDWSLDWEDLTQSPVFDSATGFGGDGNDTGEITVGEGRCVIDGPFADLQLPFYNGDDHLHCLSRGFRDGDILGRLPGIQTHPKAIEKIYHESDYQFFFLSLEHGPHNEIPNGIGGDFVKFTAPNDPLFFLHHTQLDRMWWHWQQIDQRKRLSEYKGVARHGSGDRATLQDILPMGGFAADVAVLDVMDTESGLLCYRY